jgi:hypothetical protein
VLIFSGCNSHPATGSLQPVAIAGAQTGQAQTGQSDFGCSKGVRCHGPKNRRRKELDRFRLNRQRPRSAVTGLGEGQASAAFEILKLGYSPGEALRKDLRDHVVKEIGALARTDDIHFTDSLPKTRSGKIMRRLFWDIAGGVESGGDTSALEDLTVLVQLRRFESPTAAEKE